MPTSVVKNIQTVGARIQSIIGPVFGNTPPAFLETDEYSSAFLETEEGIILKKGWQLGNNPALIIQVSFGIETLKCCAGNVKGDAISDPGCAGTGVGLGLNIDVADLLLVIPLPAVGGRDLKTPLIPYFVLASGFNAGKLFLRQSEEFERACNKGREREREVMHS